MKSSNLCFLAPYIFSLADNDTDTSKTHLKKGEEIIKLDFYLRLHNTENFALSGLSLLKDLQMLYNN